MDKMQGAQRMITWQRKTEGCPNRDQPGRVHRDNLKDT